MVTPKSEVTIRPKSVFVAPKKSPPLDSLSKASFAPPLAPLAIKPNLPVVRKVPDPRERKSNGNEDSVNNRKGSIVCANAGTFMGVAPGAAVNCGLSNVPCGVVAKGVDVATGISGSQLNVDQMENINEARNNQSQVSNTTPGYQGLVQGEDGKAANSACATSVPYDSSCTNCNANNDDGDLSAVGATPWLRIERRINEIRALASAQLNGQETDTREKPAVGIYGNYKTRFEGGSNWNKEALHPLSYSTIQRIKMQRQEQSQKDNWSFFYNFIKPRRRPFANLQQLSQCYRNIKSNAGAGGDSADVVKLLLACRELEKVIEQQHVVLDMLDFDLREVQQLMTFPQQIGKLEFEKVASPGPTSQPFYPMGDMPVFIKGRVALLPKQHN